MKRMIVLANTLVLISICICGCSDSTVPIPAPAIEMTLKAVVETSGEENYVRAEIRVENTGDKIASYPMTCRPFRGIYLIDKDGASLRLHPTEPALCPPGFDHLGAGESLGSSLDLIWAWDENNSKYIIPPGEYTIVGSFYYHFNGQNESSYLKKELPIELE